MNRWPPQGGYKLTLLHHVRGHDQFLTIIPGSYHQGGLVRAPHVHFQVTTRQDRYVTQVFIPVNGVRPRDRWLDAVRRPEALVANVIRQSPDAVELEWNIFLAIS